MSKKLWSVFTDDMDHCYFTGTPYCHRHHIFYGPYRSMSEKYGFVIPIAYYLHENYPDSVHQNPNKGIDLELKQMAQKYFEEHYGTRENRAQTAVKLKYIQSLIRRLIRSKKMHLSMRKMQDWTC